MDSETQDNIHSIVIAVLIFAFWVILCVLDYRSYKNKEENQTKINIEAMSKGYIQEVQGNKTIWVKKELEK